MGACVSTQNQNQNPSPMKQLFGSNLLKPLSPTQQKPPIVNAKPHSHPPASFGSKDETFFDSQAWLESDCDDDFMSVNGEFTPSRGSTPVHHNFSAGNNNKQQAPVSLFPYPNTPEKKPRLSDLFKESLRAEDNYDFEDEDGDGDGDGDGEKKSNVVSNGHVKTKRERLGCFRSLVPSRSSSTNGRKMMSPSPNPSPKPVVG